MEKWTKDSETQWSNATRLITASVLYNERASRWFAVVVGRDVFEVAPVSKTLASAKATATRLAKRMLLNTVSWLC